MGAQTTQSQQSHGWTPAPNPNAILLARSRTTPCLVATADTVNLDAKAQVQQPEQLPVQTQDLRIVDRYADSVDKLDVMRGDAAPTHGHVQPDMLLQPREEAPAIIKPPEMKGVTVIDYDRAQEKIRQERKQIENMLKTIRKERDREAKEQKWVQQKQLHQDYIQRQKEIDKEVDGLRPNMKKGMKEVEQQEKFQKKQIRIEYDKNCSELNKELSSLMPELKKDLREAKEMKKFQKEQIKLDYAKRQSEIDKKADCLNPKLKLDMKEVEELKNFQKKQLKIDHDQRESELNKELSTLRPKLEKGLKQIDIEERDRLNQERKQFAQRNKEVVKDMSKEERKLYNKVVNYSNPKDPYEQQFIESYLDDVKKQFTTIQKVPLESEKEQKKPTGVFKNLNNSYLSLGQEIGQGAFYRPTTSIQGGLGGAFTQRQLPSANRYANIFNK